MKEAEFLFSDVVVINKYDIGVIVKTWEDVKNNTYNYDVYNRMTSKIEEYREENIKRYRVRHKYLNEEEYEYQNS
jgi:hypothetical protein